MTTHYQLGLLSEPAPDGRKNASRVVQFQMQKAGPSAWQSVLERQPKARRVISAMLDRGSLTHVNRWGTCPRPTVPHSNRRASAAQLFGGGSRFRRSRDAPDTVWLAPWLPLHRGN